MTTQPPPTPPRSADPGALIGQALRAQVGGPKPAAPQESSPIRGAAVGRFTSAQLLLLAAILGLVVGMAVGFVVIAG